MVRARRQQGAVVYVMGGIGGVSTRVRAMLKRYDMAPDIPFFIVGNIQLSR